MMADGLLQSLLSTFIRGVPTWLVVAFGFVLFFTKRESRPHAANLVLIALILEIFNALFGPLLFAYLLGLMQDRTPITVGLIGMVVYLPGVLGYALLLYAAMLPDQASQRRYRRYDEDEFETLEDEPRR